MAVNLRHKDKETDIFLYRMRRVNGRWTAPEISPYGGMPAFSVSGDKLIYIAPESDNEKVFNIAKHGENWSTPKPINIIKRFPELKYLYGPSITANGTLYFFAHAEGGGSLNNFGIYRSEFQDGEYLKPELLPSEINTENESSIGLPIFRLMKAIFCSHLAVILLILIMVIFLFVSESLMGAGQKPLIWVRILIQIVRNVFPACHRMANICSLPAG